MNTCIDCAGTGQMTRDRVDGSGGFIRIVSEVKPCGKCSTGAVTVTEKPKTKPHNGYELAARQRKAWLLYDAAQRLNVEARDIDDAEVRGAVLTCARLDGPVKDASDATWALVAEHLAKQTGDAA